ncbi:MAG: DUF721 domain-containing protein [Pyrinomonadaceae bacterium]
MERLFAAIPGVLSGLGPNIKADEAIVFAAWRSCAGEMLNERTAAVEFIENRLVVAVTDETWRRHLEDLSPEMLARINGRIEKGTVRFIEFVIDAQAVRNSVTPGEVDAGVVDAEISADLAAAAEAIKDDRLHKQFISAAAAYLSKQERLK